MRKQSNFKSYLNKKRFIRDFGTGAFTIIELSKKYKVNRLVLQNWKKEVFGVGSFQNKKILELHKKGISDFEISIYLKSHLVHIQRILRK